MRVIEGPPEERRRYLDLAMNLETRERFRKRSAIITEMRAFLDGEDFLEVETPALQPLYGGAAPPAALRRSKQATPSRIRT